MVYNGEDNSLRMKIFFKEGLLKQDRLKCANRLLNFCDKISSLCLTKYILDGKVVFLLHVQSTKMKS